MDARACPCPRCGGATDRRRFPWLLRPLRLAVRTLQWRRCPLCSWRGLVRAARRAGQEHAPGKALPH